MGKHFIDDPKYDCILDHFIDAPRYVDIISKEHRDIIKKYTKEYPVKIASIARDCGLEVKSVYLDDHISGYLKKLSNPSSGFFYLIGVNEKHSETRKRFTIAHELAHFFLHRENLSDTNEEDMLYRSTIVNRTVEDDHKEVEANRLAAKLLMSLEHIRKIADELKLEYPKDGEVDYIELTAQKLNVSKLALKIRLGIPLEEG